MNKSFNFFKNKLKKQQEKHEYEFRFREAAKSNSSKNSYRNKINSKIIQQNYTHTPLTKKEREIRQAIEIRYEKSRLRNFTYQLQGEDEHSSQKSDKSCDMKEFRHLKKLNQVTLKDYHRRESEQVKSNKSISGISNSSEGQQQKMQWKFKLADKNNSRLKTEGNESHQSKFNYFEQKQGNTKKVASRMNNKTQEWKFISIEIKQNNDTGKSRTRSNQNEMRINSHRGFNLQGKTDDGKTNLSSDKVRMKMVVPKLKGLERLKPRMR